MAGIHSAAMQKDEWLTPPAVIEALGDFDLDPCAPINRPWPTATKHYTVDDDGLMLPWDGRVWCNPPYGQETWRWLDRMALHGNGIALVFARTETEMFFKSVWGLCSILFLRGRLHFYDINGKRAKHNSGAPSCLLAYGYQNSIALRDCGLSGAFIDRVITT